MPHPVGLASSVSPSQIASFGAQNFAAAKGVLMFYPLIYVVWLFFIFNRSASIATYQELATENFILDFPSS